jgi:deoxyxylulose-5-phosphate synthase
MECTVINARFLKPFDKATALNFAENKHFTIEDHTLSGGLYSALSETLAPVKNGGIHGFGWDPDEVIAHGEVSLLKADAGLTAADIAQKIAGIMKNF